MGLWQQMWSCLQRTPTLQPSLCSIRTRLFLSEAPAFALPCHRGLPHPRLTHTFTLRLGKRLGLRISNPSTYRGSIILLGVRGHFSSRIWETGIMSATIVKSRNQLFDISTIITQHNFLGWENSQTYTDRAWTGSKSTTTARSPRLLM